MKYFTIDKNVTVTGVLPSQGNNRPKKCKDYSINGAWIVKTLAEQVNKNDFDDVKVKVEE